MSLFTYENQIDYFARRRFVPVECRSVNPARTGATYVG
jgi:hypothetical protein